jgi:hypothetical protein
MSHEQCVIEMHRRNLTHLTRLHRDAQCGVPLDIEILGSDKDRLESFVVKLNGQVSALSFRHVPACVTRFLERDRMYLMTT